MTIMYEPSLECPICGHKKSYEGCCDTCRRISEEKFCCIWTEHWQLAIDSLFRIIDERFKNIRDFSMNDAIGWLHEARPLKVVDSNNNILSDAGSILCPSCKKIRGRQWFCGNCNAPMKNRCFAMSSNKYSNLLINLQDIKKSGFASDMMWKINVAIATLAKSYSFEPLTWPLPNIGPVIAISHPNPSGIPLFNDQTPVSMFDGGGGE